MLDGLKNDMLHILVNLFVYDYKCKNLGKNGTDYELRYEIIALNAIAENITLSIARMFDGTGGVRSFMKLNNYINDKQFRVKIDNFKKNEGKALINKRHTKLAHMHANNKTTFDIVQLPTYVTDAISFAINTLDELNGSNIEYIYRFGSTTEPINLKNELCK